MDTISFDRTLFPESSIIEQLDYNHAEQKLLVTIHDSRYQYLYHDVQPLTFSLLAGAVSVGQNYNRWVKGQHDVQRVERRLVDVDAE